MNAIGLAQTINRTLLNPKVGESREQYLFRLQRAIFAGQNTDEFQALWFDRFAGQGLELEISGLAFMDAEEISFFHLLFSLPEVLDDLDELLADPVTVRALSKHPKLVRIALPDRVEMFTTRCRELGFVMGAA